MRINRLLPSNTDWPKRAGPGESASRPGRDRVADLVTQHTSTPARDDDNFTRVSAFLCLECFWIETIHHDYAK